MTSYFKDFESFHLTVCLVFKFKKIMFFGKLHIGKNFINLSFFIKVMIIIKKITSIGNKKLHLSCNLLATYIYN